MNEKTRLLKIPIKERTREQHLRLIELFGGVREYLKSMGNFKDEDELAELMREKLKKIKMEGKNG